MSLAGLLGALYVYMTMHAFGFSSFFAFHPSAVSFAALPWLPPPQSDSCSAICGWRSAWPVGRASTLALLDYSEVIGRPASRMFCQPTSVVGGRLFVIQVRWSLAVFRVGILSAFGSCQSYSRFCEPRLTTREGSGAGTLLV